MSLYKNFFITVSACLLVQGCATQPLSPTQAAQYKRIAVISSMGDDFMTNQVEITASGNEHASHKVDVGVDTLFAAEIIKALSRTYDVSNLNRYGKSFADQPKYWPDTKQIGMDTRPSAGELVKRLVGPETYDAYIVIAPDSAHIGNSNLGVEGVGIAEVPRPFAREACFLHAAYVMSLIDGRNFNVVATARASSLHKTFLVFGNQDNVPSARVDCSLRSAPDHSLPVIKQSLETLLDRSVPKTLKDVQLVH